MSSKIKIKLTEQKINFLVLLLLGILIIFLVNFGTNLGESDQKENILDENSSSSSANVPSQIVETPLPCSESIDINSEPFDMTLVTGESTKLEKAVTPEEIYFTWTNIDSNGRKIITSFLNEECISKISYGTETYTQETETFVIPSAQSFEFPRWANNSIAYYFSNKEECGDIFVRNLRTAFNLLKTETQRAISFYESDSGEKSIRIDCHPALEVDGDERNITSGEAQITSYDPDLKEINSATIDLYDIDCSKWRCDSIETNLHEILHILNFDHIEGKSSLMNSNGGNTFIPVDKEIINCLKRIYGEDKSYTCQGIPFLY